MAANINSEIKNPKDLIAGYELCTNRKLTLSANTSVQVFASNRQRAYALVINVSDTAVTLSLGEKSASTGEGILLLSKGSSFEITLENLYRGKISAIASAAAELSLVECSFTPDS